ncbi:MAG: hypothetical protein UHM85_04470 [Acutalibacteraceae bacterium]|nr:hypothetical protein [Acutalibacteraceae bacterium]
MKKIIALVLSFIMLASLAFPVTAVAAADESKLPVIYIVGKQNTPVYKTDENGDWLLDESGNRIQVDDVNKPMGMTREEYILTQVEPVMKELIPALITGNYTDYIQSLVDAFAPVYKEGVLDKDGTDSDGRIDWDYSVQQPSYGAGGLKYYYFKYDWRYSPYETADELHQFVEYVCDKENVEKVNIHARCYGSNVAMAYIAKSEAGLYDAPFRMNNLCLNTTPLDGYVIVGSLMSGSIKLDADMIDRYVTLYLNGDDLFDDPLMESFAMILVSFMNQIKVLGWGMDEVQAIYDEIAEELIPALALVSYGTFPSYWSMIGDNFYDKAKQMVFGTTEAEGEWAAFIEKIDAYHNLIGEIEEETGKPLYWSLLKRCEENYGMKTAVFAKYGFSSLPVFEGSEITGDARGTVTELSLGAIGTVVTETFTEKELKALEALDDYDAKYLSPDKKVYAGTCLFPETTWFSKNLHHVDLHQIDPVATAFFVSDGTLTVNDERFPQFHEYDNGNFVVVGEEDEMNSIWSNNAITVILKFVTTLLKVITAIMNGEFKFPTLGD